MQSLNRDIFERKISQVYDLIEVGDLKKAMKQVNTLIEKGGKKMHTIEKLYYKVVKAYVLDKSNRRSEALTEIDDITNEIQTNGIIDGPLIDQIESIMIDMGCFDKILSLIEKLHAKHQNDEQLTLKLFNAYAQSNDFFKMSGICAKLEKTFGHPEYALYSIQALYMFSQTKQAPANILNLVHMLIEKYKTAHYGGQKEEVPQFFIQLYFKILIALGKYQEAIDYLNQNEKSFGMRLDKRKLVVKAFYKKNDMIGAINELLSIIRDNYRNIEQFQSIYDLHELMISLFMLFCEKQELKGKINIQYIVKELDMEPIPKEGEEFSNINQDSDLLSCLKQIYSSFKKYESLDLTNKTTNFQNCRKNSILSQLLIKHKMLVILCDENLIDQFYAENSILSNPFQDHIIVYASTYIELGSMLFDLYTYIPYLNQKQKQEIVSKLQDQAQQQEESIRKARAMINIHKMKKVFSFYTYHNDLVKTLSTVKQLHQDYLSFLDLDGKPEKGERKIADDLVILINDLLIPYFHKKIDSLVLYRLGLMEYAIEQSPYNFDIQLQLIQIYDSLGLSISFNQAFNQLGLKGVQLESMGYLLQRHACDWGEFDQFRSFTQKYYKYWKLNLRDLKQLRLKALKENNYDQIENFIEYEDFITNSYFNTNVKFTHQMIDFIENLHNADFAKNFFDNMHQSIVQDNTMLKDFNEPLKKQRTQDLKVVLDLYEDIHHFFDFRKPEQQWLKEFEKDDDLREITRNDKIYAYYKYDRKSNYKNHMINSLGVFEHPQTLALIHSIMTIISNFRQNLANNKNEFPKIVDQLKIQKELYDKYSSEEDFHWRHDSKEYTLQLEQIEIITQLLISVLEIVAKLATLTKTSENELLAMKEQFLIMFQEFQAFMLSFQHNIKEKLEEVKQAEDLAHINITDTLKNRFLTVLLLGSFLPQILDLLNETLKPLLPSKKKKKGSSTEQDQLNNEILTPIKNWQKELYLFFSNHSFLDSTNYETKRKQELQNEMSKIEILDTASNEKDQKIESLIIKKIEETFKEEKACRDRLREIEANIGKRLKDTILQV